MAIDVQRYWTEPPPEPSPRLGRWLERIRGGWRPNRRVGQMGYHEAAEFYGVYLWEYFHVLVPALDAACRLRPCSPSSTATPPGPGS